MTKRGIFVSLLNEYYQSELKRIDDTLTDYSSETLEEAKTEVSNKFIGILQKYDQAAT